jgi:hypothetical protein
MSTHGCFASLFPHTRLMRPDDGAPEPPAPVADVDYDYYYYPAEDYYYEEPSDDQE